MYEEIAGFRLKRSVFFSNLTYILDQRLMSNMEKVILFFTKDAVSEMFGGVLNTPLIYSMVIISFRLQID